LTVGGRATRPFELLSDDELESIHSATLQVLQTVGVEFHDKRSLTVLEEAGAEVDHSNSKANFPEELVKEAMQNAPHSITLCGRTSDRDVRLEGSHVFFAAGANALYILEHDGPRIREAKLEDCRKLARLADALDNVHVYLTLASPQDVDARGVDRLRCAVALQNTTKHFFHDAQGEAGARDQIELASVAAGGFDMLVKRPLLSLAPCITSPFRWGGEALEVLRTMASEGLPQIISSEPLSGATSPVTLAGSLVQQNAELLSGLVLAQSVRRGCPVALCTFPSVMDMRTANLAAGAVELGLMTAGMAQLMRRYGLPYVGTGGVADSKTTDEQAAYEKAITLLLPALAGANLIHLSSGMLESILTVSYEQVVIDNEIAGMVLRALRGIEVSAETLASEVILRTGAGGHFLKDIHTLRHLREEHFIPRLTDRSTRAAWKRSGAEDVLQRAREEVDRILAEHEPAALDRDAVAAMDSSLNRMLEKARRGKGGE